jgi:transcriptional regulator of met regulon
MVAMAMKKIMVSLPMEMISILEKERKERYLETLPETIRVILSEYFRMKPKPK